MVLTAHRLFLQIVDF